MEKKELSKAYAGKRYAGKGYVDKKAMVKSAVFVLLAIALLLCLVFAVLLWRRRYGAEEGVAIRPERAHPVGVVQAYCQWDERWAEDKLGGSIYRMRGFGCLTSCIASALSTQAARMETDGETGNGMTDIDGIMIDGDRTMTGIDKVMTAGELNQIFSENQVYNGQGDIVWGRIEEAMPAVGVLVASSVDGKKIETLLDEGKYPLVKVKVGGNGAAHWVLLVGSEEEEYLCMDPLVEDGELVPLSRHGGVVYRMRCVYWVE